ncbi:hypothetical protein BRADI_2g26413v3 [Brachypodium distachyon]|uniref:Uncharacterized protein n=1 Tax=Brachypodium distachyon TaxID=15368 RepID=A0A0Q3IKV9_BRADI|nr:hypothetical protein BRADI_2g26413v3 [Brachypodium distachyon]
MPDSADLLPSQTSQPPQEASTASVNPDPDMPPRRSHGGSKLKKPLTGKLRAAAERLANLRAHLRLHPLDPPPCSLSAAASPHEAALRSLGLLDFARLDLESQPPRPDLVAQLIAYYDPSQHRSFVLGNVRLGISRTDLVRALSLPPKPASTAPPPDVDPAAVISAVLEFMQSYILPPFQGDDMCILLQEVASAEQAVKDGSAHRVDWAGLIWGLVEKEILEVPKRDDGVCYYWPYLQRLISTQKPNLFQVVKEEERGEVALEVSADTEMDEEDGDADAMSKNLELGLMDADADVRSKIMEESGFELVDEVARDKILEEPEIEGAALASNNLEELEEGDVDVRSKSMEELELGVVDVAANARSKISLETPNNGTSFDDSKAGDELELGLVSLEAVTVTHQMLTSNDEVSAEWEGDEDASRGAAEKDASPLAEMKEDEKSDGEEEKDTTGLSLGISSVNDYDSRDAEENASVENLDVDDSDNEEAKESEDDAFVGYRGGVDMDLAIGDDKGDEGTTQFSQQYDQHTFRMEFENLNKGDIGMRNEVSFDDGFSVKMGSLNGMQSTDLLHAMNSIPSTYKNGMDMGPGSSIFGGNNGKRHIGEIDGCNDHMQEQPQFSLGSQQKRMQNCNDSSVPPGSSVFNTNIAGPIQNLMLEASMLYEQKDRALQDVLLEKQHLVNLLDEKDAIIHSMDSARFEQENKRKEDLRRFEHDLNEMGKLVSGYKAALKHTAASFFEYRKKFPCNKFRYHDVAGGGGLVLGVKELERNRLKEEERNLAAANEMIHFFELEWFSKIDKWTERLNLLCSKMEGLARDIHFLKEKRKAKVATPATEE